MRSVTFRAPQPSSARAATSRAAGSSRALSAVLASRRARTAALPALGASPCRRAYVSLVHPLRTAHWRVLESAMQTPSANHVPRRTTLSADAHDQNSGHPTGGTGKGSVQQAQSHLVAVRQLHLRCRQGAQLQCCTRINARRSCSPISTSLLGQLHMLLRQADVT